MIARLDTGRDPVRRRSLGPTIGKVKRDGIYAADLRAAERNHEKRLPTFLRDLEEIAMTAPGKFQIEEHAKYGVVLRCQDAETADQFEDFLSEDNFVLFKTKFENAEVLFYFGLASSVDRVRWLLQQFDRKVD